MVWNPYVTFPGLNTVAGGEPIGFATCTVNKYFRARSFLQKTMFWVKDFLTVIIVVVTI